MQRSNLSVSTLYAIVTLGQDKERPARMEETVDARPICSILAKHRPDTPGRAERIERLGEAVIVDGARVDGEDPH